MKATNETIIKEQLITILHDKYKISLKALEQEQWDTPLTSRNFGLSGFELAHLFFEVEEKYDERFDERVLKDYGFCTINNIAKAIASN